MVLVGVKVRYFVGFVFTVVLVASILIPVELSRAQQGQQADLQVSKTDDPDPVVVGGELTYTVTVTNLGPDTAQSVTLEDIIFGLTPEGGQLTSVNFLSASDECSGREDSVSGATQVFINCALGDISPGETRVVTYVVSPTAVGTVQNFVDSNSETPDPNPDNDFFFTVTQVIPALPTLPAPAALLPITLETGQESESGDVDLSFEVSTLGDYAQQCVAPLQFANTGNLQNTQGTVQYDSDSGDVEFEGGSFLFEPAISTECDQAVQQSAAASG